MKHIKTYNEDYSGPRSEIFTVDEIYDIKDIFQDLIDEYNLVSIPPINVNMDTTDMSYRISAWDGRDSFIGRINESDYDLSYIKKLRIDIYIVTLNKVTAFSPFRTDVDNFESRLKSMNFVVKSQLLPRSWDVVLSIDIARK